MSNQNNNNNLHRIKIFSKNRQNNNNNNLANEINEDMKKLKDTLDSVSGLDLQGLEVLQGLNEKIAQLTNKNLNLKNEIKTDLDLQLGRFEIEKVKPVDTKINTLTTNFDALNSNTEALINALTDEGKINLVQLKTKIQNVKPAEIRTMRNNIKDNISNYNSLKLEVDGIKPLANQASLDVLSFNTRLQNNQNMLTNMQKATKLQINDTYLNGELYFMNCGEWGFLEGQIKLTHTMPSPQTPSYL